MAQSECHNPRHLDPRPRPSTNLAPLYEECKNDERDEHFFQLCQKIGNSHPDDLDTRLDVRKLCDS